MHSETDQDQDYDGLILLDQSYRYFDQLTEAASAWQLDFRQTGRGMANHHVLQLFTPDFGFSHVRLRCPSDQRAASPRGLRTFSILSSERAPVRWCAQTFDISTLIAMPVNNEFSAVGLGDFENYTLSLPEELLAQVAAASFQTDLANLLPERGGSFNIPPAQIAQLRHSLGLVADHIRRVQPQDLLRANWKYQLSGQVLACLAASKERTDSRRQRNQRRTISLAVEYIEQKLDQSIALAELCLASGVSERTLEYAFRDHFNLTPKQYVSTRRLSCAQRDLLRARPGVTKVIDIANRWSFWHMGQFARDYAQVFGEKPSDTLKQAG